MTESAMAGTWLPFAAALAACSPSPQEAALRSPSRPPEITARDPGEPNPTGQGGRDLERAAMGPLVEPVSAAENAAPSPSADSPAEAQGRRTLSAAFVRVGPDGHLTVKLRDGRVLVLRDVVMRPKTYCGVQELGDPARAKYCGGYAEVAAAWTGGTAAPEQPDLARPNPVEARPAKP